MFWGIYFRSKEFVLAWVVILNSWPLIQLTRLMKWPAARWCNSRSILKPCRCKPANNAHSAWIKSGNHLARTQPRNSRNQKFTAKGETRFDASRAISQECARRDRPPPNVPRSDLNRATTAEAAGFIPSAARGPMAEREGRSSRWADAIGRASAGNEPVKRE